MTIFIHISVKFRAKLAILRDTYGWISTPSFVVDNYRSMLRLQIRILKLVVKTFPFCQLPLFYQKIARSLYLLKILAQDGKCVEFRSWGYNNQFFLNRKLFFADCPFGLNGLNFATTFRGLKMIKFSRRRNNNFWAKTINVFLGYYCDFWHFTMEIGILFNLDGGFVRLITFNNVVLQSLNFEFWKFYLNIRAFFIFLLTFFSRFLFNWFDCFICTPLHPHF